MHKNKFTCAMFIFFVFHNLLNAQQNTSKCIDYSQEDSLIELSGSASDRSIYFDVPYQFEHIYLFMDTLFPCSSDKSLNNALINSLKKDFIERIYITHISVYSKNETDTATYSCPDVINSYFCLFRFDDSLFYHFTVYTDTMGKILNQKEIPEFSGRKNPFQLLSLCDAFSIAKKDRYFKKGHTESDECDLHYSYKKNLFYFEFTMSHYIQWRGNGKGESEGEVRHVFIDAHTGKVILRTKALHRIYFFHGELDVAYSETHKLKPNKLTNDVPEDDE